jgi:hypothetical protein
MKMLSIHLITEHVRRTLKLKPVPEHKLTEKRTALKNDKGMEWGD